MPQSLAKIWLHMVFSTRDRRRAFLAQPIRDQTCAYMTGILNNLDCPVARINLAIDHVHVLHLMSRTHTVADVVGTVKRRTTDWINEQEWARGNLDLHQFHWQNGYGVFSVSESMVPKVKTYIDGQMEHHQGITFQDEFRKLLRHHAIEFDERYVWD